MAFPISRLARFELRRFRGPLPKIALVFVALIPLLYGAIYLTANWDPYGKLSHLPVAVVNEDRPTTVGDKPIHAGDDFVTSLVNQRTFDWQQVDAAEAQRGLREGDYYLTVTVPADFSTNLVSGQGDDPQRAKIMLRRNDANGFVVGSITNSAQNSIARAVDQSAEEAYFNAVFANLRTIREGLLKASDGSARLATGATSARDGSAKLDTGAAQAEKGASQLSTGAAGLDSGLAGAKTGSADLAGGLKTLDTKSGQLSTGAAQVATGTQKLYDAVVPPLTKLGKALPELRSEATKIGKVLGSVADKATGQTSSISHDLNSAADDLAALKKAHPELADDPTFTKISGHLDDASGRADEIASSTRQGAEAIATVNSKLQGKDDLAAAVSKATSDITDLNDGAHAVSKGAAQLHTGIATASSGATTLATGISNASSGAHTLATGASSLSDGLTTLSTGAHDLHTGLTTLSSGAGTLHTQLDAAAKRLPAPTQDEQDRAVQVLSSPADVTTTIDNPATYYGRGLAPMFFSIALWVFGISVFLVVRPITARALSGRAGAIRLALSGWLPIGTLASVGGLLMLGTVWATLGLAPVHPLMIIGLVILAAFAFSAIAHLLRTGLGTPGSSLLLVLLILQLTSAGGTYPAPLLPGFFAVVGKAMPMTYLIDAFRVVISGGELSHLLRDVVVLAVVALLALGLCALTVRRRQQFRMRDLHPPLIAP